MYVGLWDADPVGVPTEPEGDFDGSCDSEFPVSVRDTDLDGFVFSFDRLILLDADDDRVPIS